MDINKAAFLVSVLAASISQVILKTSANMQYEHKICEYANSRVICAYIIFFLSSLITVFAYKKIPLSVGAALESSGYVWAAVFGRMIFKEHIGKRRCLGLCLIIIGIIILS